MTFPEVVKCEFILPRQMWHFGRVASDFGCQLPVCKMEGSGDSWIGWPGEILSSPEPAVHRNHRVGAWQESWVLTSGNPLLISQNGEGRGLAWGCPIADERTGLLFPDPGPHPWFGQGKTAQCGDGKVTPPSGRRERLARQLSVPAAKRPLRAVTLRRGQFTFGCFQRLKARCLEMRVLADLALSAI